MLEFGFQQTGWKQLFNSTTIDNMPLATVAVVKSVRNDVSSWGCKERKARVAKSKSGAKKKKAVAKAPAKKLTPAEAAAAEKPSTVTVDVPETTGSTSPTVQLRGTMPPPAAASFAPQ
jgi:D-alanyl-D-alanine carboxypeptidase